MWTHEKNWARSQLCYGMEYTSTRNRHKPSFNHFWSRGYVIIWSKIPIQGLSPIMNSGTKAWAFQDQSQRDNFAESLFSCVPILKWIRWNQGWDGWIISNGYMQLSSARCPSTTWTCKRPTMVRPDRQDLCTTIPLAACVHLSIRHAGECEVAGGPIMPGS